MNDKRAGAMQTVNIKQQLVFSEVMGSLAALKNPDAYILVASIPKYFDVFHASLEYFLRERDCNVLIASVNRPGPYVFDLLREWNLPTANVHVIDMITRQVMGGASGDTSNGTTYLPGPFSLPEFVSVLNETITNMNKSRNNVFLLDSIPTLVLYNKTQAVVKFLHHVINRLKFSGIPSLFLSIKNEGEDDELRYLVQFTNRILYYF